ncbi:hypothetical protein L3Q82_015693 [Scortum barcoo]|uniref:Uncharacterized protein n=1 Tax=Scortum barcoo TaxID=214431 RepID=A0ACB8VPA2_9TELE|nr:hypothetical protein L3Q82_015693 [Scortum barcoo]
MRDYLLSLCTGLGSREVAVGEAVDHSIMKLATRMNSAVVLFQVEKVNHVKETDITINCMIVSVLPLSQPTTKITSLRS